MNLETGECTIDKRKYICRPAMTTRIVPLSDKSLDQVLDILAADALSNIVLIADCTQLRGWCDVRVLTAEGRIGAVFSLY
jgi:hypothetical protein